ncbi:MAG: DUF262 domain-containing protein [bacterium]
MELIGLETLFKNKLFRIPDYQRGYAWQEPQYKDFWEDLINLQENRVHYTGVITIQKIPKEAIKNDSKEYWLVDEYNYNIYHVVDGQQRVTTCIVFLQCIIETVRELPENIGHKDDAIFFSDNLTLNEIIKNFIYMKKPKGDQYRTYKFGYLPDENSNQEYLRFNIFNESNASSIRETFYTRNLEEAKKYFLIHLKELYKQNGKKALLEQYKKITQKFLFNEYIIEDEFDVFVAFETMNFRGKNLSKLELLKNRLIYLTTLYPENVLECADRKALRDDITKSWQEVYYQLGRSKILLDDDDFLKAHWIMKFLYSRKKSDDFVSFLLYKNFISKRVNTYEEITCNNSDEQITRIEDDEIDVENDEVDDLINGQVSKPLSHSDIREYIDSLRTSSIHWFNLHYPYKAEDLNDDEKKWLDKLNRIGMGYFRPLVMSILKNQPQNEQRLEVLKLIERYIFIRYNINQLRSNKGDSEFYKAAREFDQKKIKIEDIILKLKDHESLSLDAENNLNIDNFKFYLGKKIKDKPNEGFYGWYGLKYFLYEYELKKMEDTGQSKVEWGLFIKNPKDKISIEHIYPQSESESWAKVFKDIPQNQKCVYCGSLGNLLLLSNLINSKLQNFSFQEKKNPKIDEKGDLIRRGYCDGSHSEIEISMNYENWTPIEIKNRGLSLLKFLEERWNIKLGSIEQKLDLLYLNE